MNPIKIAAIVFILAGVLALAYGGFSYTTQKHKASLGPIELSARDTKTVNIPVWAGVGAIMVGGLLFLFGRKQD
jgi:LPXTG-motif cell wall-anchored protein